MRRALVAVLASLSLAATLALGGCTAANIKQLQSAAAGAGTQAKKDCAACEKMCAVAGDAEKKPEAVAACKADCKKTCTP